MNPDGHKYSQTVYAMWRKNRAPTPQSGQVGIDINRNYDWLWNFQQYFLPGYYPAENAPASEVYCGTAAFSERETKNVKHLIDSFPFTRFFVDLHSSGELILYPWGNDSTQTVDPAQNFQNPAYDAKRGNPYDAVYGEYMSSVDVARFQAVAQRVNQAITRVRGKVYRTGPGATTLYIVSGSSKDYMYARHIVDRTHRKIDAYVFEWGEEFVPPYVEMANIVQDVSSALIELCLIAQTLPLLDKGPDPLDFRRVRIGTTKTLGVTIRNVGVGAIEIINIQIEGTGFATSASTLGPISEGATAQLPASFSPTANGPAAGRLVFRFRQPGSALTDTTDVVLSATGCSLEKGACRAPVFRPSPWYVCLLLWISAPAVLILLAIFSWTPSVRCALRAFQYRLGHCSEGNDDPCLKL